MLLVLVLGIADGAPAAAETRRPNIVLIVTDDQGYADFGFQGSSRVRTPHIDALARSGIRMTNAYVTHPYCSPTRAGLLTGRYQQRFGHENNPAFVPDDEGVGLPVGEKTLADLLRGAGYATAAIGKWHLGAALPFHPKRRGFDEFFGFLGGGHNYLSGDDAAAGNSVSTAEYTAGIEGARNSEEASSYLTDAFSDRAVDFIRRRRDRPFFLYLAYNAPHTPYQAPERYRRLFPELGDECRTYAAMISAVDDGVGRVVATLRELEIDRQTMIFLLSDNGGQVRDTCPDNAPLRGGKGGLYEGGIRVPFIAAWPGRLAPGGTFRPPVSSLDVFATARALAGLPVKARPEVGEEPPRAIDGVDLMPFLTGRQAGDPERALYWRVGGGVSWAVRQGRWKLITRRRGAELYDLDADVGETRNLAAEHPEQVRALTALYRSWNAQLMPPRWSNPS